jgi:hypothetical protein
VPDIEGLLTDSLGDPLSGISVELTGDSSVSVRSDADGVFRFPNLTPGGSYTVRPVGGSDYSFDPAERTYSNIQGAHADTYTAAGCEATLSPSEITFGRRGGSGAFMITATPGCSWPVSTADQWIHITSVPPDGGSGVVEFIVEENLSVSARTGNIVVGGEAATVMQLGMTTAAEVSISGRVRTASGLGIRNASVVISGNSLSQPRSTTTGSFGSYSLGGLRAGETYIVTVNSRRYTFTVPSRVLTLVDNLVDVDFVAQP